MTEEEARLRLAVVPPRSELSFWTIVMVEEDGTMWLLTKDATYTSAVQKYDVVSVDDPRAADTKLLRFTDKDSADFVCEGWNDLTDKDDDPVFLPVRLKRKIELA